MNDRQQLALDSLRYVSGGEWVDADPVARRMRAHGDERATAQGIGRILSKLADDGHFEKSFAGGVHRYRVPMHAVVVYGDDGEEFGRILLVQAKGGMILDVTQVEGLLAQRGQQVLLHDRDVRTVRSACDETLYRTSGWRR